jgi:N5-(carboxyethyl)ornithine synthase
MKTVGFLISLKENENRRALTPMSLQSIKYKDCIFIERNYGEVLGYSDEEYISVGCSVVSREEILKKDVVCDLKISDAEYLDSLSPGQAVFGWIHAVQTRTIADKIIANKITGIAWENMFYMRRHTFRKNNELAGAAAIMHAFPLYGYLPDDVKVAVIGRGNVAKGAMTILTRLGADITVFDRKMEKLFQKEMGKYDVIVNAVLWDTTRKDHIIYKTDLPKLKKGAIIIDVSCDRNGAIETSVPTSIENPTYYVDGILHYAVDHTPSIFYKSASIMLSDIVSGYVDNLITGELDEVLSNAIIIKDGVVVDKKTRIALKKADQKSFLPEKLRLFFQRMRD